MDYELFPLLVCIVNNNIFLGKNTIYLICVVVKIARKTSFSTGPEPVVSTGSAPGTAWSVLTVRALSTGQADWY